MRKGNKIAVFAAAICIVLAASANADSIVLKSGNAPIGQLDPQITVRGADVVVNGVGRSSAPGIPMQQALVISPCYAWYPAPDGSNWIGCNWDTFGPAGGYIYQTSFVLPQGLSGPHMNILASSDNGGNIYLNGSLLSSIGPNGCTGHNWRETYIIDDPSLFHSGTNTLEFWVYNSEGPTGLAFSAVVDYTPVPEPSSIFALLLGITGVGGIALSKNHKLG